MSVICFNLDHSKILSSSNGLRLYKADARSIIPCSANIPSKGWMIVIVTEFILSSLSIILMMVMWESSLWLGKNMLRSATKNPRETWIGALDIAILLK